MKNAKLSFISLLSCSLLFACSSEGTSTPGNGGSGGNSEGGSSAGQNGTAGADGTGGRVGTGGNTGTGGTDGTAGAGGTGGANGTGGTGGAGGTGGTAGAGGKGGTGGTGTGGAGTGGAGTGGAGTGGAGTGGAGTGGNGGTGGTGTGGAGTGGAATGGGAGYGIATRPSNSGCVAPARPPEASGDYTWQDAWWGDNAPLLVKQAPGNNNVWYELARRGVISTITNENAQTRTTWLTVTTRQDIEQGLWGLAFHPNFPVTPYVYVSYTRTDESHIIERYTVNGSGAITANSAFTILVINKLARNHQGGSIEFGKDGFLYISLGDSADTTTSQNTNSLLGKMLRIDVDGASPYRNPPSNPYAGGGGRGEIFAIGFRNPFRFSIDVGTTTVPGTGAVWVGDVGESAWEEHNIVQLGGNYGWPITEGLVCRTANCNRSGLIDPVHVYGRGDGISTVGGHVYRGSNYPELQGAYIFGDTFSPGNSWILRQGSNGQYTRSNIGNSGGQWVYFGANNAGEIYGVQMSGPIKKLVRTSNPPASTFPQRLSQTGCFDSNNPTIPSAAMIPFDLNAPLWSDGSSKRRWMAIPDGQTITVNASGDFEFPIGTVLAKEFTLNNQRVETRLYMRHPDGGWGGYSYAWNTQQTEATLLTTGERRSWNGTDWVYPSRVECDSCHTQAAGFALGPEISQLNRNFTYPGNTVANQIATLNHIGMFTSNPGNPAQLARLTEPGNTAAPIADRARAYLHANCSSCHRPGAITSSNSRSQVGDLRATATMTQANLCSVDPGAGNLGITGAKLIAPADVSRSIVHQRMARRGAYQMPPLATEVLDQSALTIIRNWIETNACP